jgi:acyl transferase domain-containing protein
MTITMSQNGVHSPEGICRTFDANANGYGRGEAINAIYVKPLRLAIQDWNPVCAVIRATGSNFGGRTPNITSPCPEAQEALIRSTYARAGILVIRDAALFECHGTATIAGDTVEALVVAEDFGGHGVWMGAV